MIRNQRPVSPRISAALRLAVGVTCVGSLFAIAHPITASAQGWRRRPNPPAPTAQPRVKCVVPNVVGLDILQAISTLSAAGCPQSREAWDGPVAQKNIVFEQRPAAGTALPDNGYSYVQVNFYDIVQTGKKW
jgi:PASTA domain